MLFWYDMLYLLMFCWTALIYISFHESSFNCLLVYYGSLQITWCTNLNKLKDLVRKDIHYSMDYCIWHNQRNKPQIWTRQSTQEINKRRRVRNSRSTKATKSYRKWHIPAAYTLTSPWSIPKSKSSNTGGNLLTEQYIYTGIWSRAERAGLLEWRGGG